MHCVQVESNMFFCCTVLLTQTVLGNIKYYINYVWWIIWLGRFLNCFKIIESGFFYHTKNKLNIGLEILVRCTYKISQKSFDSFGLQWCANWDQNKNCCKIQHFFGFWRLKEIFRWTLKKNCLCNSDLTMLIIWVKVKTLNSNSIITYTT